MSRVQTFILPRDWEGGRRDFQIRPKIVSEGLTQPWSLATQEASAV